MYFLVTATVLVYLAVIVVIVMGFGEFTFSGAKWILGINVVLYFAVSGITVSGWNQRGSILNAALVTLYSSLWCLIGLGNSPSNMAIQKWPMYLDFTLNSVYFLMGIGYLTFCSSTASSKQMQQQKELEPEEDQDDLRVYRTSNFPTFHFIMAVGSVYLTVIKSNWE